MFFFLGASASRAQLDCCTSVSFFFNALREQGSATAQPGSWLSRNLLVHSLMGGGECAPLKCAWDALLRQLVHKGVVVFARRQ